MTAFLDVDNSCRGLRWQSRCEDEAAITELQQVKSLDNLTARLLAGRAVSPDTAEEFLDPSLRGSMPDPSSLQDMDKAASLIMDAVQAKKKITDYILGYYSQVRPHQYNGGLTPNESELQFWKEYKTVAKTS